MQRENRPYELHREANKDLFDLRVARYWLAFVYHSVLRHRVLSSACFAAILALSIVALKVLPYRYQVQAVVLATRSPMMGALTNPGMNRDWDLPTRSAREAVLRRDNLVALCKQTDFVNQYMKTRAPAVRALHWLKETVTGKGLDPKEVEEGIVDALQQRLWVNVNVNEGLVDFTFQWSDPNLAFEMVTAAVQGFLEVRHASEVGGIEETISILQSHDNRILSDLTTLTRDREDKEKSVRSRPVPRAAPRIPAMAIDAETTNLRAQLTARRRSLADLEDFRRRRLQELQIQLNQEIPVYAEQHPTLASTRRSIESLSAPSPQVAALQSEIKSLESELERRGTRIEVAPSDLNTTLQAELAEAQLRVGDDDPRQEVERNQLRLLLREHSYLLERIDAARVEMDTTKAGFKYRYAVTSPPQLPKGPLSPKPWMVVMGGLLGGLAFAVFASVFVDIRSGRLYEAWQVTELLDVPLLGEIER